MAGLKKIFYRSADFLDMQWIFYPGMLFASLEKWWNQGSLRICAHEGIDMLACMDREGQILKVDTNTEVPAVFEGQIIRVLKDFLGMSVFLMHHIYDERNRRLCTVYGHTDPDAGVLEGEVLKSGDIIGRVAAVNKCERIVPPHLHLTVAWIPAEVSRLDWEIMGCCDAITLVDPLQILTCKYLDCNIRRDLTHPPQSAAVTGGM